MSSSESDTAAGGFCFAYYVTGLIVYTYILRVYLHNLPINRLKAARRKLVGFFTGFCLADYECPARSDNDEITITIIIFQRRRYLRPSTETA